MCLDGAQLEDYNQNNYSGLTPASGLLANDRRNTNGCISSCLFACVHEVCVFEQVGVTTTFADRSKKKKKVNSDYFLRC